MQIEVMESSNQPDCDDELIQRKSVSFNKKVSIIRVQSFKEKNKENCYANCISKKERIKERSNY